MKPTAPGSLSHIFAFAIYFSFAFIFRSIKLKIQKYLAAIYSYLFYLAFDLSVYYKLPHVRLPILGRRYPKGIDNPFYTSGCEKLLFVCRCCLRCVAWFSYWFDNLGFISEGNTYRCCAASSLPLWGNTDVASSDITLLLLWGGLPREEDEYELVQGMNCLVRAQGSTPPYGGD